MKNERNIWEIIEDLNILHPRIHYSILGTKKEVNELPSLLVDNEVIYFLTVGFWKWKVWLIVATSDRVILLNKGIFVTRTISFSYSAIESFYLKSEKGTMTIYIHDGNKNIKLEFCLPSDAKRIGDIIQRQRKNTNKLFKHRR